MNALRIAIGASILSLTMATAVLAAEQPNVTVVEKCQAMMKDKELMRTMMKTMPRNEMMECHRMMQNKNAQATDASTPESTEHEHHHGE